MEAASPIAAIASTAVAAAQGASADTADAAATAAFQLPGVDAESGPPVAGGATRTSRRAASGEAVPDGGNLLPLVIGLLPPVISLTATVASPPPTVATEAASPATVAPPVLAALAQATRAAPERGAKPAAPSRSATPSPFDQLLARGLPADARAALAAAVQAAGPPTADTSAAQVVTAAPASAGAPITDAPPELSALPVTLAAPAPPAVAGGAVVAGDRATTSHVASGERDSPSRPPLALHESIGAAARDDGGNAAAAAGPVPDFDFDATLAFDAAPPPTRATEAAAPPFASLVTTAPRTGEGTAVMNLAAPVASPGWSDALGDRVSWMVQQDVGQAHLKLNPPQLGPVEVRVQISGDQASVSFTAHNQQARDALEGASQKLRDLLGAQGFVNVQVDVGQQAFHERPTLLAPYDDAPSASPQVVARAPSSLSAARSLRTLLDAYA